MFEDIKAGDEVYVLAPIWDRILKKVVSRTTNTQVIIDGLRYRKSNGNMIGGSPSHSYIRPKTHELDEEFEEYNTKKAFQRLVFKLDGMQNYSKVTPEIVAKLQAIYDEVMSDE